MFSYILLFLSSIPLLSKGKNFKLDSQQYGLLLTSALFAYSILGFISIELIYLNRSRFPIFYISILIFLLTIFFNKSSFNTYIKIKNFLISEINKFKKDYVKAREESRRRAEDRWESFLAGVQVTAIGGCVLLGVAGYYSYKS